MDGHGTGANNNRRPYNENRNQGPGMERVWKRFNPDMQRRLKGWGVCEKDQEVGIWSSKSGQVRVCVYEMGEFDMGCQRGSRGNGGNKEEAPKSTWVVRFDRKQPASHSNLSWGYLCLSLPQSC